MVYSVTLHLIKLNKTAMDAGRSNHIKEAQTTLASIQEISQLLNTGLSPEALTICVRFFNILIYIINSCYTDRIIVRGLFSNWKLTG
ncbi:hypothetical protein GWI33_010657 [Rhynchophorus ferrugineus]|uniref:Uncharacterized protein n=1 Tax=Rhynchophorus ferrugineus TaxID=354439 RepID=A0A834MK81_RHYFE|nr:hypothetical protein GWI33_010657 [Rhynchophorus ferrugineus]